MRQAALNKVVEGGILELPIDLESDPPRLAQQMAFIEDTVHRIQGYGGGFGNGKTTAGAVKAFLLSILYPENQGMICRWEGNDLRTSTMQEFFKICPRQCIEKPNMQLGIIKFKRQYGGSTILFQGLKDKLVGTNLGWFWIDQAEEVPEDRFADLIGRLRRETPLYDEEQKLLGYAPTFGLVTFNPEGSSHWLYKFLHPDSTARIPDSAIYMASTYEGAAAGFVQPEYIEGIKRVYPEAAQKRYLEGTWDSFQGRIFPDFDPAVHRIPRITPEPRWYLYETIDWGPQSPTAVGWYAFTPPCAVCGRPTRLLLDEHYEGGGKGVAHHAAIIKSRRSQFAPHKIQLTYLDSQCWAKTQSDGTTTRSIRDLFVEEGIIPVAGAKDWDVAFTRITESLKPCPGAVHPVTGQTNVPHFFYAEHCRHFETEALSYVWKKKRTVRSGAETDEPIDFNDHHMDAWSYLEASYAPAPPIVVVKEPENVLEQLIERRKTYNPLTADLVHQGTWMSV